MRLLFAPRLVLLDPRRRLEVVLLAGSVWLIWWDPVTIATLNQSGGARVIGLLGAAMAVRLGVKWVWMAVAPNPALEVSEQSLTVRACSPPTKVVLLSDIAGVSSSQAMVSIALRDGRTIAIFVEALRDQSGSEIDEMALRDRLIGLVREANSS